MPKDYVNPDTLFASLPHGFSQAVATTGRRTIYVSGQTAWSVDRQVRGGMDLAAQARAALGNLRLALQAGGADLGDTVALRIYVVNYTQELAPVLSDALNAAFPGPHKPAATWLGVAALANPDFLIEIEAVAVLE